MLKASIDYQAKLIDYWNEHWYNILNNEKEVIATLPSVTSIIDKVVAKGFGYDNFLMQSGSEAKIIARESAEKGSKIHDAIERLINGCIVSAEIDSFELPEWKKLNKWLKWYEELGITPITTESTVFDLELKIAGTADFICKIGKDVWLLDWKTGKNIYKTHEAQVSAYVKCWNKNKDKDLPKITKAGIVHIGACTKKKDGLNNVGVKVYPVEIAQAYKQFKAIKSLYDWLYPNETAPSNIYPLELQIQGGVLSA